MSATPLQIDQDITAYAALAARLRKAPEDRAADVLARAGVTGAGWSAAHASWTRAIQDELAQGGHEIVLAYADSFRAVEREAAPEAEWSPRAPASVGTILDTPPTPLVQPAPTDASKLPTYLQPSPAAPTTSDASSSAVHAATDRRGRGQPVGAETVDADFRSIVAAVESGALPFAPVTPRSTSEPSLAPNPATSRRPRVGAETVDAAELSALIVAASPPSLPFEPAPAVPTTAPARARRGPPPVGSGTVDADFRVIAATAERGPLPFSRPKSETSMGEAAPDAERELSLETYAAITAALARGDRREDVFRQHRISAEHFTRQAQAWSERLQQAPELLARFKELVGKGR